MFTYFSLVYSDGLHLVEKRNLRLGKSILKATDSNSNANPLKYAVCFNLNECDFPELPSPATRCKLLYSPVKCVGPVCKPIRRVFIFLLKVMDLFVQLSYLFVLYPSQFLTVHSVNLLLPLRTGVRTVRITTATFSSHIPNVCYTNASIRSFSSELKTTSALKSSLSSHQKYTPTSALKSPYSSDLESVSSPPVATLSISSHFPFHQ